MIPFKTYHGLTDSDPSVIAGLKQLGSNIRHIRQSRAITQEALADKCGIHRTYLCDVERGTRNISFSSLLKLARGLGLSAGELLRDTGPSLMPPLRPFNEYVIIRGFQREPGD